MATTAFFNRFSGRFTAIVLTVFLVFSMQPVAVHADEYTEEGWHYASEMDGYLLDDTMKQEVSAGVSSILLALPLTGDQKTDVILLYNYVKNHVSYDYSRPLNPMSATAYQALHGSAVCEGYASLFLNLCTQAGIDCHLYMSGKANHAWNIVVIDGAAYVCDTTWDSCVNKGKERNAYCLIAPAAYAPMKNDDVEDKTVLYRIGEKDYFLRTNMNHGKYILNSDSMCVYLFNAAGQWQSAGSDVVYPCAGTSVTPDEFVYYHQTHLIEGRDYLVTYANNAAAGLASITLNGIGSYEGSVTYAFTIAP